MPRFLREVSRCDTGVELLGRLPAPALLTPVGVQAMLHPEAAGTGNASPPSETPAESLRRAAE